MKINYTCLIRGTDGSRFKLMVFSVVSCLLCVCNLCGVAVGKRNESKHGFVATK